MLLDEQKCNFTFSFLKNFFFLNVKNLWLCSIDSAIRGGLMHQKPKKIRADGDNETAECKLVGFLPPQFKQAHICNTH